MTPGQESALVGMWWSDIPGFGTVPLILDRQLLDDVLEELLDDSDEAGEHGEDTGLESFATLASELIASAEEDANDAGPSGTARIDPHTPSSISSLLPPPSDTPIRRPDALCLRNLFAFPAPGNSPSATTLLTKFWTRSENNLAHEIAQYDEDIALEGQARRVARGGELDG